MHNSFRSALGKTLLVASALTVSSVASAQVYVGGSVGQSMTSFNNEVKSTDPGDSNSEEKTKTAYKLFGGYNFNQYFAVEGGYADLGKPAVKQTWVDGSGKGTFKETAWFLAGKGTLPINEQFNVFGKLGVTFNHVKNSSSDTDGWSYSASDNRTGVLYGVGAEYNVTKQIGIRLEYEDFGKFGDKLSVDGESGIGRTKTSMWSIGAAYKF